MKLILYVILAAVFMPWQVQAKNNQPETVSDLMSVDEEQPAPRESLSSAQAPVEAPTAPPKRKVSKQDEEFANSLISDADQAEKMRQKSIKDEKIRETREARQAAAQKRRHKSTRAIVKSKAIKGNYKIVYFNEQDFKRIPANKQEISEDIRQAAQNHAYQGTDTIDVDNSSKEPAVPAAKAASTP